MQLQATNRKLYSASSRLLEERQPLEGFGNDITRASNSANQRHLARRIDFFAKRSAIGYLANMSLIKGETGEWEIVLGLEVHAQVISDAKLFSGAPTAFGADPNTQVSLVDAAMPGMLPVINQRCVEQAIRTGLGLNAKINLRSIFDRKNYFYQDLPQGYQISQYKDPIVGEGAVEIDLPDGKTRTIGIERLHLEQDAGKSLHDQHPSQTCA